MCRGLAICVNKDGRVICNGTNNHNNLKESVGDAFGETWLDFECIYPDITPILDKRDEYIVSVWKEMGLLDIRNKPKKELVNAVQTWLDEHRTQVMEWFLFKPHLMTNAVINGNQDHQNQTIKGDQNHQNQTIKGDQSHRDQTIEGNQYHQKQTIKGDQNHWSQTIKGDQDHRDQTIKGDQNHWSQTIGGNQDHDNQTIKGNQFHRDQTIEGDQDHQNQTIKGDQNHRDQTIEGDQYHQKQTIGGKIYIRGLKQGDKTLQNALNKFYQSTQKEYTWGTFYQWVLEQKSKGAK